MAIAYHKIERLRQDRNGQMRFTVTYDKIIHQAVKNLPCPVCGKKVRRKATFWQTLNPYNCVDGRPKTEREIRAELAADAVTWQAVPEPHWKCA